MYRYSFIHIYVTTDFRESATTQRELNGTENAKIDSVSTYVYTHLTQNMPVRLDENTH